MIYIIKQEGLYQNKVNSSLVFTCNCKMGYLNFRSEDHFTDQCLQMKYRRGINTATDKEIHERNGARDNTKLEKVNYMDYTSLGWLGKQQNALPINNSATFVGTANSGISKTLCNLALSFWLWKSDELPTKKIRECCAKETQLSLISKIVASCFISKQNKQFGSNLPNIKTCKCDLIVNTTLQLNICKFVLHEKLIKMRGEYVRGISDLSPLHTVEPLHISHLADRIKRPL